MKNNRLSRIISLALTVAMLCALVLPGTAVASAAGETYQKTNLIADPNFDLSEGFVTDHTLGRWNNYNLDKTTDGRSGSGAKFTGTREASLEHDIDGASFAPGATYIFSVWVKAPAGTLQVGAKNFGGSQTTTAVTNGSDWTRYSVEFTYTSGNPRVFIYHPQGTNAEAYVDDASLTVKSDVETAQIENGSISVTGTALDMTAFTAVYTSSLNPTVSNTLDLIAGDGVLKFEPIAAAPLEQTITVVLTYKGQNITLSYDIDADPNAAAIPVQLATVTVTNGTVTITLVEPPTLAPTAADFQFALTVDGGKAPFRSSRFAYDNDATVTVEFEPVSSSLTADQEVTLTVTCGEDSVSRSFTVAQGTSHTYYVSNAGSDSNDGLSPEAPFQTVAKLNTLTFVPGDRILFQKGGTFTGMFKPLGSGAEGVPICVGSYGDQDAPKPILTPDYTQSFQHRLTSQVDTVNGAIWLQNVEYWEVRDLELAGGTYSHTNHAVNDLTVFDAGIRLINEDKGDLSHFVFDNLTIHGFRGPGSNHGKTSGGIQFNVNADSADPVPSCFVDVSVTNCEIYECGRSGINSLTPWAYRKNTEELWSGLSGSEYSPNRPYYPSRNFYMANCSIHDIDGDGLIVDTWSNAVVENNIAHHCAMHLGAMKAAVGLFNWNSDNVVFQYNECYANGIGGTWHTGNTVQTGVIAQDAQGIEVDALNHNTWVQFNYLHDNSCFMMLCCFSNQYISYDTCIRYNVSENEGCGKGTHMTMGYFYNGSHGIRTEVYNNTLIMSPNVLDGGTIKLLTFNNSTEYKFYNNIFCYTGETPAQVGNWSPNGTDFTNNIFIGITNAPTNKGNVTLDSADGLFVGGEGAEAYRLAVDTYNGQGATLPSMEDGMFVHTDRAGVVIDPTAPGIGAYVYAG